jgi:hypothetical protein
LSPNFAQIGITQIHFLYNLGSLILAFVVIPFLLLLYPILAPCKKFTRVENFRRKIWTWVFWSQTIATITESYLILVVCVAINTLHVSFFFLTFAIDAIQCRRKSDKLNICNHLRSRTDCFSTYHVHLCYQAL